MNRIPPLPVLAAAAALLLFPGCRGGGESFTAAEEREALRIANDPTVYERGKGTAAEFITNKCYHPGITCSIVRSGPGRRDYAECVRKVAGFAADMERGFAWREPRRRIRIPELAAAPRLDGVPETDEWHGALTFHGEYPLDATRKNEEPSIWRFGHREGVLYIAAEFRDHTPEVRRGLSQKSPEPLYTGDSLELFLRPDNRHPCYYELLVNPAGELWTMRHAAKETGSWRILDESFDSDLRAATCIAPEGYSIELAVPLERLYAASPGETIRPGAEFSLMPVRTDRSGTQWLRSVPVPLLYDGHNLFGYMVAELGRPGEPPAVSSFHER